MLLCRWSRKYSSLASGRPTSAQRLRQRMKAAKGGQDAEPEQSELRGACAVASDVCYRPRAVGTHLATHLARVACRLSQGKHTQCPMLTRRVLLRWIVLASSH